MKDLNTGVFHRGVAELADAKGEAFSVKLKLCWQDDSLETYEMMGKEIRVNLGSNPSSRVMNLRPLGFITRL